MKAATGELNLTVITLIAIAAVIGFFWFMWPNIKSSIAGQWDNINTYSENGNAQSNTGGNPNITGAGHGMIVNNLK